MLISEAYRKEQQVLHQNPNYGVASVSYAPMVSSVINQLQVSELLDYGCGKGRLAQSLELDHGIEVYQYDPAIPEISDAPESCQMVACIDVLEHIEPDCLDNVLDDLKRVTEEIGFFSVHTGPAVKTLSDGRNAHLTQEDYTWWLPKFWSRFHIHNMTHTQSGFYVVAYGTH